MPTSAGIELRIAEAGETLLALYDKLAEAGVVNARAYWSGGGDEGEIHTVEFSRPNDTEGEIGVDVSDELARAFDDALTDVLDARYGSWGDGDGGCGSFEANVVEKTTHLAHGYRFEDELYDHVSDLTSVSPTDTDLQRLLEDAWTRADNAKTAAHRLEGVWTGRKLLSLAAEYSEGAVTGFGYETEWNIDDEGNSFPTATVRPQVNEQKLVDDDGDPTDDEALYDFGVDGLNALFDEDEDKIMSLAEIEAYTKRWEQV